MSFLLQKYVSPCLLKCYWILTINYWTHACACMWFNWLLRWPNKTHCSYYYHLYSFQETTMYKWYLIKLISESEKDFKCFSIDSGVLYVRFNMHNWDVLNDWANHGCFKYLIGMIWWLRFYSEFLFFAAENNAIKTIRVEKVLIIIDKHRKASVH